MPPNNAMEPSAFELTVNAPRLIAAVEENPVQMSFSAIFALSAVFSGHHAVMASSNSRARSSGPAGRGDSFVTRCCGSVPSTSAGMSDEE